MPSKPSYANHPVLMLLVLSSILLGCGKAQYLESLEGKWKVSEIDYVMDNGNTMISYPTDQYFTFYSTSYTSWENNAIKEFGTFSVNNAITQINFNSTLGHYSMKILEKTDNYQHWRTKNKLIDLYLEFKMDKVE